MLFEGASHFGGDFVARDKIIIERAIFQLLPATVGTGKAPLSEPELIWLTLADAVQDGEIDLLSALRWNYGLVERLYGRDVELQNILSWAETPSLVPAARLVTGEGGAGKTLLAATAARSLCERGWTAGFLKPGSPIEFSVTKGKGLFVILDYPEESLELTRALIEKLAELKTAPYPVRLLLLSRRDFAHWERETLILEGRFGRRAIAAPAALTVDDATELIGEATRNFAKYAKMPRPPLREARDWLNEAELHRLPLFAGAAAIHAVLAPKAAFGIDGTAIVLDLANRERLRVQKVSRGLGLGDATLGRFLALGVVADGLSQSVVEELVAVGIGDGHPKDHILSALADTPWWKAGRLVRLQPDRPAAAFLDRELFDIKYPQGDRRLSDWLAIALGGSMTNFGSRLGRILFDLDTIDQSRSGPHPLESKLYAMLKADPSRAISFAPVASGDVPYPVAGFAAEVAILLAGMTADQSIAAFYRNNAAAFLAEVGRREEALAAAIEATGLYRGLARARPEAFTPDLAGSLNTLANRLSGLGREEEALAAAQETTGLYRDLVRVRPEAFTPKLAGSLNTLANMLSGLGQREAALAAAQEAAGLYRDLVRARPEAITPDLAGSLNTLADMLSRLAQREEALAVAREAAGLYRELVRARPEAFTPDLAGSLNTLANRLSDLGRGEEALAAVQEAVKIRRDLARIRPEAFRPDLAISLKNVAHRLSLDRQLDAALAAAQEAAGLYRELVRARPEVFMGDLAGSLATLADIFSKRRQREEALAAAQEATELYRDLARARPEAITPDLALSLNDVAVMLSELDWHEEALAAAQAAVAILRDLARARPKVFTGDLAMSLNSLANRLGTLGQGEEALAVAQEATELYRDLARARPDVFPLYLANSLYNLANRLSGFGRDEEALAAAQEAVTIRRDLAREWPYPHMSWLAASLRMLAGKLFELRRDEEARAAAQEAVSVEEAARVLASTSDRRTA